MYQHIIELKKNTPTEILSQLLATAESAFDNHAGKLSNASTSPYSLVYVGDEDAYCCLGVGMYTLKKNKHFLSHVVSWHYLDEDPMENCDVLKVRMPLVV